MYQAQGCYFFFFKDSFMIKNVDDDEIQKQVIYVHLENFSQFIGIQNKIFLLALNIQM